MTLDVFVFCKLYYRKLFKNCIYMVLDKPQNDKMIYVKKIPNSLYIFKHEFLNNLEIKNWKKLTG